MSWCAVKNYNKKTQTIHKFLISGCLKIPTIKFGFLLQAAKLIICHQKCSYVQIILKKSAFGMVWVQYQWEVTVFNRLVDSVITCNPAQREEPD